VRNSVCLALASGAGGDSGSLFSAAWLQASTGKTVCALCGLGKAQFVAGKSSCDSWYGAGLRCRSTLTGVPFGLSQHCWLVRGPDRPSPVHLLRGACGSFRIHHCLHTLAVSGIVLSLASLRPLARRTRLPARQEPFSRREAKPRATPALRAAFLPSRAASCATPARTAPLPDRALPLAKLASSTPSARLSATSASSATPARGPRQARPPARLAALVRTLRLPAALVACNSACEACRAAASALLKLSLTWCYPQVNTPRNRPVLPAAARARSAPSRLLP
jgi:hypothetical protein